jgi:hypothetical protein
MTRARIGPALAALVALLALAGPALAAAPIEGSWRADSGDLYEFYALGSDRYGMRVTNGSNPCFPDGDTTTRLSGSGQHYSGTVPYYLDSDCSFVGDGSLTIDIAAAGDSAAWHSEPPAGTSCCTFDRTLERVAPAESELPGLVRRAETRLEARFAAFDRAAGRRARRRAFRALRNTAHRERGRIAGFDAVSDDDLALQSCAVSALARLERAARARHRRQMQRLRGAVGGCLGG